MKLSIIIPTLNEEKNIERVIKQFEKLNGKYSYEVLIGDGNSSDKTVKLARKLGAKVYINHNPHQTIAQNRNLAAKHAIGEILLFCDADIALKNVTQFAERVLETFTDKKIIAANPYLKVFPKERIWKDKIFQIIFNNLIQFSFFIHYPFSFGQCQIVRASAFKKVGGYNPQQVHAEDSTLFHKLGKLGKLKFISDITIFESPRRYRKMGYLKLILKSFTSIFYQTIFKKNYLKEWKRVD